MAETVIVNAETGEQETRPLTAEEEAQRDADAQVAADRRAVEDAENMNRTTLEDRASTALQTNRDFLALTSPSNAQVVAQVRALTRQNTALIRLLLRRLDATD